MKLPAPPLIYYYILFVETEIKSEEESSDGN
jgi:hypothetical protein